MVCDDCRDARPTPGPKVVQVRTLDQGNRAVDLTGAVAYSSKRRANDKLDCTESHPHPRLREDGPVFVHCILRLPGHPGWIGVGPQAKSRDKADYTKPPEYIELAVDDVRGILAAFGHEFPPVCPPPPTATTSLTAAADQDTAPKRKRSTNRGDGRAKLIAALTLHHKYSDDGCLHLEPIGNNDLAAKARVSGSTASQFFKEAFLGYVQYKLCCRDPASLLASLKLLNGDYSPHHFQRSRPAGEDGCDEK